MIIYIGELTKKSMFFIRMGTISSKVSNFKVNNFLMKSTESFGLYLGKYELMLWAKLIWIMVIL